MRDHLSWETWYSWQKVPHFSVTEPAMKDNLSWEITFLCPMRFYCNVLTTTKQLLCSSSLKKTTVEPALKDHPIGHKNVVCQERWSLVTGSVILKCRSSCWKCVVWQDRWFVMAVVSQDRLHCTRHLTSNFKRWLDLSPQLWPCKISNTMLGSSLNQESRYV